MFFEMVVTKYTSLSKNTDSNFCEGICKLILIYSEKSSDGEI